MKELIACQFIFKKSTTAAICTCMATCSRKIDARIVCKWCTAYGSPRNGQMLVSLWQGSGQVLKHVFHSLTSPCWCFMKEKMCLICISLSLLYTINAMNNIVWLDITSANTWRDSSAKSSLLPISAITIFGEALRLSSATQRLARSNESFWS